MENSRPGSNDVPSVVVRYCDRCARRTSTLNFDERSFQELCQDCWDRLARLRGTRMQLL
jgi:hypothetical protein